MIEYLLYMWQIEDLIRAFQFDIAKIEKQIIEPYELSEDDKKSLYEWYESLIEMMQMEGVKEKGHLQLNKNTIIILNDFHQELFASNQESEYNRQFYAILPSINHLRQMQGENDLGDIELAFTFLYGLMLLKMKGSEISTDTIKAKEDVSKFLQLLNRHYFRYLNGELRFDQ